jgi:hypothetical protein
MQTKTENRLPLQLFPSNLINPKSKWLAMESATPWQDIEEQLEDLFEERGRNAIPVRWIVGALIIQAERKTSDREIMEDIMEMPMLQYFFGLDEYVMEPLFDFSLLCKYRQR